MAGATDVEGFVRSVLRAVEDEAVAHADDRWWVLEPLLFVERHGEVRSAELRRSRTALRALRGAAGPAALPEALGARRTAVALHVDLARGSEIGAAVVVLAVTPMLHALQVADVGRTDAGLPRLGPWRPGEVDEDEVAAALRRLAAGG